MSDRVDLCLDRFAWFLMSVPVGFRKVNRTWMRFGPYRWGASLMNRKETPE